MDAHNTTTSQPPVVDAETVRVFVAMALTLTLIAMIFTVALYVLNTYGINNGNDMMTNMPILSVACVSVVALLLMLSAVSLCMFILYRLRETAHSTRSSR